MIVPNFPEAKHQLVASLADLSDRELIAQCQEHRDRGQFFTVLFCRYGAIVYATIQHAVASQSQAEYLFAIVWRQIFQDIQKVQIPPASNPVDWQAWIIDITGKVLNQIEISSLAQTRYALAAAPPPLWCYLELALDRIPPLLRLIVVMADSLQWDERRISAYLQGEGETIAPADIPAYLSEGYRALEMALPEDIRSIYLVTDTKCNP
jgi:hypothetical protein